MITIYDYVASKNPKGAAKVISSFGMNPVRTNARELGKQLGYCAKRNGGEVLRRIVLIHPDRQLFDFERKQIEEKKEKEMSNASGCGCSNATGNEPTVIGGSDLEKEMLKLNSEKDSKLLTQNNLVIGGIIVLGLAIIMKK